MTPEAMAKSSALYDRLWAQAVAVAEKDVDPQLRALFVQSINEVIDLDETRLTAGRNRIPDIIWLSLYSVTILTMAALGYEFGLKAERSWPVTLLLTLALMAVLGLIADLDRPQAGFLQASQQALIDLVDKIGAPRP